MFWNKRRDPDRLRFQHYVPLRLSTNIPAILAKKANEEDYSEAYKNLRQLLASETFVMACTIGTSRPDIVTDIFRQNDASDEQLMEVTRDGLEKIVASIEQKGEINLNRLASSFMTSEAGMSPERGLSADLTIEEINNLGRIFVFGYTFGHDHPQRLLEMLKSRFQQPDTAGVNTALIVGMLSIYSSIIEKDDECFLLNADDLDGMRLAYENGTLPEKWVSIYQNIASKLVRDYELTVGFPK